MSEIRLGISMGAGTEELIQRVLDDLDDQTLDKVGIQRELAPSEGLSGEPISVGVIIVGGIVVVSTILRLIERHMETKRQRETLRIVMEGYSRDPKLGKLLSELAEQHSRISISYGLASEAWTQGNNGSD